MNADAQAADAVLTERRDGVLVVALNRPDARNAVNAAVAQGIADAMEELEGDGELRVGVLTGAGGTLCAGMAAEDARFGIPEVKRGLFAAGGGLIRLPKRIPYHMAMELALTGDPVEAPRARELGLVNRVTAPGRPCPPPSSWPRRSPATARSPSTPRSGWSRGRGRRQVGAGSTSK